MENTQQASIFSAVRHTLGAIGGYVVGKGWASEEVVMQLIGAALAIIPLLWGIWDKYNTERKARAREVVAVNVGIAVADRTYGVTPPVSETKAPQIIEDFASIAPVALEGTDVGPRVTPESPLLPPGPAKPRK